jgi:hypothetical protein
VETIAASDPGNFHAAVARLHARRQQQLWVLSGDGTVQWIAEYLASLDDGWSPELLLLGGGRSNIVPRETGGYPAMRALRRALRAHAQGTPLRRERITTLKLTQQGRETRHGFLFAGGMIDEGVRILSEHRARGSGWLHRSLAADFYALLRLLVLIGLRRSPMPAYTYMSVRMVDGPHLENAPMRVLLASTLAMRDALYNPFAATGEGSVRLTAIAATAPHFWRRLPGVLRGRFAAAMTPQRGVVSGRCTAAEVTGIAAYSLDGEPFAADPARPLRLESGIELAVLRP